MITKKLVLASQNKNKAKEIKNILGSEYEVLTLSEVGLENFDVIEDGNTFEENAVKKAFEVYKEIKIPTIADDSGLCVDALDGRPGIYSARYAGENSTDDDRINKLLDELKNVKTDDRGAEFVCVIAYVNSDNKDEAQTFKGICRGFIIDEKRGNNGFGYDPVFFYPEFNKTLAELGGDIKNSISHRFYAIEKFAEKLD